MEKVSVIIPMYHSEVFIGQCLQSVIRQDYKNLEILVMDDGSTDRGAQICEELAILDDRIRLHRLEHGGVSHARNRGLEIATGEYIFFLDSDDTIHPRLLSEYVRLAKAEHAEMVFCHYRKLKTEQMEQAMDKDLISDTLPRWQMAEGEKAEEWFHLKYMNEMLGIGGKMVRRSLIGELEFDEGLARGEDTWFLYHLISKQIRVIQVCEKWYYYRVHAKSATHSLPGESGKQYFASSRRVRDEEYQKGRLKFAARWENLMIAQMQRNYTVQKSVRNKEGCRNVRGIAVVEGEHSLFKALYFSEKFLYYCCFYCHPLYRLLNGMLPVLLKIKEAMQ